MTALEFQQQLKDELVKVFKNCKYKDPSGNRVPLNFFTQHLPVADREDEDDPFPYIIVKLAGGDDPGNGPGNYSIRAILVIGVYDEDRDAQGHQDVLNIIHKIYERFSLDPRLDDEAIYLIENGSGDNGFHWAIQEDAYYPYFIGACTMNFAIPSIRREDKYS